MEHTAPNFKPGRFVLAALLLGGCTTALVKDDTRQSTVGTAHCAGSEWADDSSIAAVPYPFVAIFTPRIYMHDIKADDYLRHCGDRSELVNRKVEVSRTACIPAALSWVFTMGVWQWCPINVFWQTDVRSR
jgi:hypothetical protein